MNDTSVNDAGTQVNEDDWHSVTDAKKRKKIQDRLAQRARRKRLQEAKKNAKLNLQDAKGHRNSDTQSDEFCPGVSKAQSRNLFLDNVDPIPCSENILVPTSSSRSPPSECSSLGRAPNLSHERPYPLTVYGALFINGQILGLSCSTPGASRSPPVSSDIPLPLQPTTTQLLTLHFLGIDRFPFPKMRDNFINMNDFIDEEDFTLDLFTVPSFSITPGCTSWDPRAWKIEKPFADKWGFLFR